MLGDEETIMPILAKVIQNCCQHLIMLVVLVDNIVSLILNRLFFIFLFLDKSTDRISVSNVHTFDQLNKKTTV